MNGPKSEAQRIGTAAQPFSDTSKTLPHGKPRRPASVPGHLIPQAESDMPQEPEPSSTDAVFVIACLLIVLICFVMLMSDFAAMILRESIERFMFRG